MSQRLRRTQVCGVLREGVIPESQSRQNKDNCRRRDRSCTFGDTDTYEFSQRQGANKGSKHLIFLRADCRHIVSGGGEGSVRVWEIRRGLTRRGFAAVTTTALLFTLKEHQNTVTCIKVRRNDAECVTSSYDGSCVIWDLQ